MGFGSLLGFVVMSLWNWLMPLLFGLTTITFWQAIGLFVLAKILFGGWKGHHGGHGPRNKYWAQRFKAKWENMSEEEREKYRKCRGGRFGQPQWESEKEGNTND